MANKLEALNLLLEGKVLEGGERYYRFNKELNEVQFSDNKKEWKPSDITINNFLKWDNWNVVE